MTQIEIIPFDAGEALLDWLDLTDALISGHDQPKAEIADTFLYRGKDTLLNRAAWIDGLGLAVKSATVFPGNPAKGAPMVNGGVSLYGDADGALEKYSDRRGRDPGARVARGLFGAFPRCPIPNLEPIRPKCRSHGGRYSRAFHCPRS